MRSAPSGTQQTGVTVNWRTGRYATFCTFLATILIDTVGEVELSSCKVRIRFCLACMQVCSFTTQPPPFTRIATYHVATALQPPLSDRNHTAHLQCVLRRLMQPGINRVVSLPTRGTLTKAGVYSSLRNIQDTNQMVF